MWDYLEEAHAGQIEIKEKTPGIFLIARGWHVTNCITEKGKYDLAPRILTINCSLVTKKYTFQYNKGMLVAVRTNYTKILPCFLCLLQMVKGGVSETRIEKRIVITGDADIDHDEVSI